MQLELKWTFSKNYTYDNITKLGKYSNIRIFTSISRSVPNATYVIDKDYQHYPEYLWSQVNETIIPVLNEFSATCFYTAQMLSDNHGMSNINFGLIDVAVGGTMIESWTKNHTMFFLKIALRVLIAGRPSCTKIFLQIIRKFQIKIVLQ